MDRGCTTNNAISSFKPASFDADKSIFEAPGTKGQQDHVTISTSKDAPPFQHLLKPIRHRSKSPSQKEEVKPAFGQGQLRKTGGITRTDSMLKNKKKAVDRTNSTDSFDSVQLRLTGRMEAVASLKEQVLIQPRRIRDKEQNDDQNQGDSQNPPVNLAWMAGVLNKIPNATTSSEAPFVGQAVVLQQRILAAKGPSQQRRLSVSDNELVCALVKATMNDPAVTEIYIDADNRFKNIKPDLLVTFAESLRTNLNLCKLTLRGLELGNDFLSALADSISTNFILEHLDLSDNGFTNDALVDFCLGMAENESILSLNLSKQHSPIFSIRQEAAVEALAKNKTVQSLGVEFQSKACNNKVQEIADRNNKAAPHSTQNYSQKLLRHLEEEAILAEKRQQERKDEVVAEKLTQADMPYLVELSNRADRFKVPLDLGKEEDSSKKVGSFILGKDKVSPLSLSKIAANQLSKDGSFLSEEYFTQFIQQDDENNVVFNYNNQTRVFKRFCVTDPDRAFIVKRFVDTLLSHPKAQDLTHIYMVNAMIGNDLIEYMCHQCRETKAFGNIHLFNFETNFLSGKSVIALAECIKELNVWPYLQVLRLDNQKHLISSEAEDQLARALCSNRSLIKLSLRVRNLYERRRINQFIVRNLDFLRQARRWNAIKTGTLKERARNRAEIMFDKVADNDPSITSIDITSDQLFMSLHPREIIKAARSFKTNSTVKSLKMCCLRLNDEFALELAESLRANSSIEKVNVENNCIGTVGSMALISSLSTNKTVSELFLRHQAKKMASSDEESIPRVLEDNNTLIKLGLDIRSTKARYSIDQMIKRNQGIRRRTNSGRINRTPSCVRNRVQEYFARVARNDESITEVEVIRDPVFLALKQSEQINIAKAFASNVHITSIKLTGLKLDDKWAEAFAESLSANSSIEKIDLESNAIGSTGMLAILTSLTDSCVTEVSLRHQSKTMTSADEERIPELLNDTILKLGVTIRNNNVRDTIEKRLRKNQDEKRRQRARNKACSS